MWHGRFSSHPTRDSLKLTERTRHRYRRARAPHPFTCGSRSVPAVRSKPSARSFDTAFRPRVGPLHRTWLVPSSAKHMRSSAKSSVSHLSPNDAGNKTRANLRCNETISAHLLPDCLSLISRACTSSVLVVLPRKFALRGNRWPTKTWPSFSSLFCRNRCRFTPNCQLFPRVKVYGHCSRLVTILTKHNNVHSKFLKIV